MRGGGGGTTRYLCQITMPHTTLHASVEKRSDHIKAWSVGRERRSYSKRRTLKWCLVGSTGVQFGRWRPYFVLDCIAAVLSSCVPEWSGFWVFCFVLFLCVYFSDTCWRVMK